MSEGGTWTRVFSSASETEIAMLKGFLEAEGIGSISINKKDSFYLFGEIELYVQAEDVLRANQLIASRQTS